MSNQSFDRRVFLKQAAAAAGLALLPAGCQWSSVAKIGAARPSGPKPNVVLILADDLGSGDLGCYGATRIKTPNLDALASQGVRCTDAHASAAVCTPSRYGLLTGRYYFRNTVKRPAWSLMLDDGQPTLASAMKSAGYATACIGKWHLGFGRQEPDYNGELKPGPLEVGFDYYFGTPRTHNEPPFVFVEGHQVVGIDKNDPLVMVPQDKTPKGEGWGHGLSKGAKAAHAARPEDQIDIILTQKAVGFIESNKEKPFFLYLPFLAPHVPLSPSARFRGTSKTGVYGDYIQELDWCVGEVLKTLDRHGLADNTLVLFGSDNGAINYDWVFATGHRPNNPWLGQKTDAWEGGCRVPLIARWPGHIPKNSQSDKLITLLDMLPTVCAATGVKPPQGAAPDAVNQWPVLSKPQTAKAARKEMVYQGIYGLALRQGDWVFIPQQGSLGVTTDPKMTWAMSFKQLGLKNSDFDAEGQLKPDAPKGQLYNLAQDPGQSQNLYASEPKRVKKMAARLKELSGR